MSDRKHEAVGTGQSGRRRAKHQRKSERPVKRYRNRKVHHVLDRDVDRIATAGESRFETQKTRLHQEHQARTQHHPHHINVDRTHRIILFPVPAARDGAIRPIDRTKLVHQAGLHTVQPDLRKLSARKVPPRVLRRRSWHNGRCSHCPSHRSA